MSILSILSLSWLLSGSVLPLRCFSHTKLIFCCHFRYILVEFILSHLCNFFAYSYHPCVSQTCDQTVPFFREHNILNRKSRGWDCPFSLAMLPPPSPNNFCAATVSGSFQKKNAWSQVSVLSVQSDILWCQSIWSYFCSPQQEWLRDSLCTLY